MLLLTTEQPKWQTMLWSQLDTRYWWTTQTPQTALVKVSATKHNLYFWSIKVVKVCSTDLNHKAEISSKARFYKSLCMTKPTKWPVHPVAVRMKKVGSLATHKVHSEDSDQTGKMHRLIWVFTVHTSFCWFCHAAAHKTYFAHISQQNV